MSNEGYLPFFKISLLKIVLLVLNLRDPLPGGGVEISLGHGDGAGGQGGHGNVLQADHRVEALGSALKF